MGEADTVPRTRHQRLLRLKLENLEATFLDEAAPFLGSTSALSSATAAHYSLSPSNLSALAMASSGRAVCVVHCSTNDLSQTSCVCFRIVFEFQFPNNDSPKTLTAANRRSRGSTITLTSNPSVSDNSSIVDNLKYGR